MFGRRTILGGIVGASAAPALGRVAPRAASRIRYNVASANGQAMLAVYAAGVAKMKSFSPDDPRSWNFEWYTHSTPIAKAQMLTQVFGTNHGPNYQLAVATWTTCQAHGNPANEPFFVFWHRLYVLYLERMIASLTGTPGFTLPYWDYTAPANAALPPQFRMQGDPKWGTLYQPNRNVKGNGFANVNAGDPIDKYAPGTLTLESMKQASFNSFNSTLDKQLHGNVHGLVGNGTNMGYVPTAAGDPIFWLHHANIDRIWYAWAANGGVSPTTFTTTYTFTNPDSTPAVVALNTVAQNSMLDYTYDALPKPPPALHATVRAASAPMTVLLTSAPMTKALRGSAPIVLDGAPKVVSLHAARSGAMLSASVRGLGAQGGLKLVIRGVAANAPPGTLFGVYLDLPAGLSPDAQAPYRVGILNFFDAVAMPGMENMPGMSGRDYEFDLTGVAKRLALSNKLPSASAITIVPLGTPEAGSAPTITGNIEIVSE